MKRKYIPGTSSKLCPPVAVNAPELAAAKTIGEVSPALTCKVQVALLNEPESTKETGSKRASAAPPSTIYFRLVALASRDSPYVLIAM